MNIRNKTILRSDNIATQRLKFDTVLVEEFKLFSTVTQLLRIKKNGMEYLTSFVLYRVKYSLRKSMRLTEECRGSSLRRPQIFGSKHSTQECRVTIILIN